ncbi:MAG: hypothetical protein WA373_12840 [Burkholderiales bacterium]
MRMRILLASCVLAGAANAVWAKLPPSPPVDPAQAAAAKQKADDAAKKETELLSKAQDRAVANYHKKNTGVKAAPAATKTATKKK